MDINDRIKYRRKELGLSVEQVASRLKISRASYYRYESTEVSNLPITAVVPLATILNVSPAWIMGWEYSTPVVGIEKDLLNDFRQLSADNQKQILNQIQFMKYMQDNEAKKEEQNLG